MDKNEILVTGRVQERVVTWRIVTWRGVTIHRRLICGELGVTWSNVILRFTCDHIHHQVKRW